MQMLIPGNFTPSEPSDNMATLPINLQLFGVRAISF
jgi:hypothetical protein